MGGGSQKVTNDDEGEGGGHDTPQNWWRHLWTAPYQHCMQLQYTPITNIYRKIISDNDIGDHVMFSIEEYSFYTGKDVKKAQRQKQNTTAKTQFFIPSWRNKFYLRSIFPLSHNKI